MEQYFKYSYKEQTNAAPLTVHNVGYQRCRPGYGWGTGVRDHFLLHYIVSGSGVYTVEQSAYPVTAGQIFLIRPHRLVQYTADRKDPWEYYWLGFSGPYGEEIIAHSPFGDGSSVISVEYGENVRNDITNIYAARGRSVHCQAKMLGYAYLLLSRLVEEGAAPQDDDVAAAAGFLQNSYTNPISIEEVARYIGISRSWLYRGFLQRYGVSPNGYLRKLRLDRAKTLLISTQLGIGEIARSVGYTDALYFTKVFSQAVGVSPTAYRRARHR